MVEAAVIARLAESLRFCLAQDSYMEPDWMSANQVSGEDYLSGWYAPLLEKGAQLPFHLVFDLGLKFWQGTHFVPIANTGPYAGLLQKATTSFLKFDETDRFAWMLHLNKTGQAGTRYLHSRLLAVPVFLESLLPFLCGQFPEEPYLDPVQVREAAGHWAEVVDDFRKKQRQAVSYQPVGQPAPDLAMIPALYAARAAYFAMRPPQSMDQDLLCLQNYAQVSSVLSEEVTRSKVRSARRAAENSRLIQLRAAGGDMRGLTYTPLSIAQLVKNQLGLLRKKQSLFLQRFYDRKLLYQERGLQVHTPLRLLTVLLIDTRPAMRRVLHPQRGSRLAIGRAFAAGCVDDLCRAFGDLPEVILDFAVQFAPAPEGESTCFFRYDQRYRSLDTENHPLLLLIPEFMHLYFRYFPPQPEPDQPGPEPFSTVSSALIASVQENFERYQREARISRDPVETSTDYQLGLLLGITQMPGIEHYEQFLPYQHLPAQHKGICMLNLEEKSATLHLQKVRHTCAIRSGWQEDFQPVMQELRGQFLGHVIQHMLRYCALA